MRKVLNIVLPVIACFLIGMTASYLQSDSINSWYPTLNKPSLTPPNIVFPIAWSTIYLLIGISIGLVLNSKSRDKKPILILFVVQLFFNFAWSLVFFYMQNPLLGFIDILILDILVAYYIYRSYPAVKLSAWLFIPYLVWILFATYLNGYILLNN